MNNIEDFFQQLTNPERAVIERFAAPIDIQRFLDTLPYSTDSFYRCPLRVLRDRTAHCFDGALFAAAMLRRLGFPPLILDLLPNERDDDHLLALFKFDGYWGAVAKSNFVGLRFREPVYRSIRELVMSYFEHYFNVAAEKTLRAYAGPLNLIGFDRLHWMTEDYGLEQIAQRLDQLRRISIISERSVGILSPVDDRSYQAGLLGANQAGLFKIN
ncbi:MAG: hypothetical protein ONB13_03550 [candidate division KSB1 bacterium]|nr:hypothetical protein [candidate division KSB1 bacterium]MDZ7333928.1 hypothetical protein [candidate division KSB1 bacterium]MDZ7358612.1 hypothetical protein [candidate division KSB1 bacterium]MDZ7375675.1 hypothetical protein [candidate division KSB1 bacterium]MDZ7399174.1 hypothetical protein [candidate division KSB1 bacterium]